MFRTLCLLIFIPALAWSDAKAATGEPVAIRKWPDGVLTLETFSGHQIKVEPDAKWTISPELEKAADKSISVETISLDSHDAKAIRVEASGTRIVIVSGESLGHKWAETLPTALAADALVIGGSDVDRLTSAQVKRLVDHVDPTSVVLIGFDSQSDLFGEVAEAMLGKKQTRRIPHNTLAVVHSSASPRTLDVIAMSDQPWSMPTEMDALFTAMEKSCAASQEVFAKLSVEQMNFKPSNGTHTPRWNAEHMMGRQLKFFSEIYHAIDPAIGVMDLNPKQMPPDYRAAHADWDGAQEAKQMQRVSDFCRRYAYLLDGISVTDKPPASRWPTLAALLGQMDRHYAEHTANTVNKFQLPDWPQN